MQPSPSAPNASPLIHAMMQLNEKPRRGSETRRTAVKQGPNVCNFTVTLGLQAVVVENGVRKTYSARYYNPATGRFLSRDPLDGKAKDPASLHKYLYAGGDPVNMTDPTGHEAQLQYEQPPAVIDVRAIPAVMALACGINIAYSVDALRTPSGSFAGISVDWLHCSATKDCTPYEEAIQRAMRQVQNRYDALVADVNNLWCFAYKDPVPGRKGTWLGHVQQFLDRQAQLQQAVSAAIAAGCPVPQKAYDLLALTPPACPD